MIVGMWDFLQKGQDLDVCMHGRLDGFMVWMDFM